MNCYLRLPHYVGSYLRNRSESNPIRIGEPIQIHSFSYVWSVYMAYLVDNSALKVSSSFIFSERQYKAMMDGRSISDGMISESSLLGRENTSLTDDRVYQLAGLKTKNQQVSSEDVAIQLPKEIIKRDRLCKVNEDWMLSDYGASTVRGLLTDEFWATMNFYFDKAKEYSAAQKACLTNADIFERFMLRYDIRCGSNRVELDNLKRNFYRKRKILMGDSDLYVEFGK